MKKYFLLLPILLFLAQTGQVIAQEEAPKQNNLPAPAAIAPQKEASPAPAAGASQKDNLPAPAVIAPTVYPIPVNCGAACCPKTRYWGGAEFLLWWIKDAPLPALATTTNNLADPRRGALDLASTTVLYGGNAEFDLFSGGRFTLGGWLNDQNNLGLEGSAFFLGRQSDTFAAGNGQIGGAPLYIPAFRSDLGANGSFIISDPIFPAGGVLNITSTCEMWGAEINGIFNFNTPNDFYLHGLVGFRYLDLDESFRLDAVVTGNAPAFAVTLFDQFATENQFYGGQLGARFGLTRGRLLLDVTAKVALGWTHQSVDVSGAITQAGFPAANAGGVLGTSPGGLFSQPTNLGTRSRDVFTVVPEVQMKVGYQVSKNLSAFLGYDILYWSNVARPGDQMDRAINKTQQAGGVLAGPATPQARLESTDFWAQGFTFGVEFKY